MTEPSTGRELSASQHSGSARPVPQRATASGGETPELVRERLAQATAQIIARGTAPVDPDAAAQEKETVRAARYLMGLLARRRRSEHELRERLAQREVPAAIAHEAVARVARAGLLDDAAFAEEWVRQRRELRGLGDEALRRELEAKGVDENLIRAALAGGERDEEERCHDLVRDRLRQELARHGEELLNVGSPAWSRARRRLDAYLARRGYIGDMAVRVISAEMRALTGR